MAAVTIDTTNRTNYPLVDSVLTAKVWTKPNWAASWTLRPDLAPLDCRWTSGSTMASATLHYRYGSICLPGAASFTTYVPITARGYYVLIAWATHDGNPLYWLGFAESAITSATGWPTQWTSPSASSNSSWAIVLIWLTPGMSAAFTSW